MKDKISILIWILLVAFAVSSCKTHEERVTDRLNNLSEKIQKNGEKWDYEEWLDALDELEDIHADMEDCEFTPEQFRELGRVEGKLTVIIMTEGAKKLGNDLTSFMEGAGSFMKGYQEGAKSIENYQESEFKKMNTQYNERIEEITDEQEIIDEQISTN